MYRRVHWGLVALLVVGGMLGSPRMLVAEDRDQWQQPERVVQDMGLKAGACVADIGCGRGYFTYLKYQVFLRFRKAR